MSLFSRVRRALPRLLGVVLGLAMMVRWEDAGILGVIGFGVFLLSVPTHPSRWWRQVMTGVDPRPPTDPTYLEPGAFRVDLVTVRDNVRFEVLKAVREVSVLEFTAAKDLVDHPPGTVASGLSAASAERVRARVARAGGAGTVVEETDARR